MTDVFGLDGFAFMLDNPTNAFIFDDWHDEYSRDVLYEDDVIWV